MLYSSRMPVSPEDFFSIFWIFFFDIGFLALIHLPSESGWWAQWHCAHRIQTVLNGTAFASGHTALNTPDPIRTRKLSSARPGQYWGGGPPGKSLGCCWLFAFLEPQGQGGRPVGLLYGCLSPRGLG